ncbi:hypothetical protein [Sphingobium sp. TKS]|nr:hypothetical protein [Sphingobium sp. TKS]AMK26276.1 hypothetical protein K426_26895 [Sphingobium sp. TKS]
MKNERGRTRIWILLGTATAVLALLVLAWRLLGGEWLWVVLNGIMQGELR